MASCEPCILESFEVFEECRVHPFRWLCGWGFDCLFLDGVLFTFRRCHHSRSTGETQNILIVDDRIVIRRRLRSFWWPTAIAKSFICGVRLSVKLYDNALLQIVNSRVRVLNANYSTIVFVTRYVLAWMNSALARSISAREERARAQPGLRMTIAQRQTWVLLVSEN